MTKRYRWTNFYIDTQRSILKIPGLPDKEKNRIIFQFAENICQNFGSANLESKLGRWLSLSPPALCAPVEYHVLLQEVEVSYVAGHYYPSLTSACCLGERILNHLILAVRDEHKNSTHYKKVYRKDSFDNWELVIKVLSDWNVFGKDVADNFTQLLKLRNPSIHFGDVSARAKDSKIALDLIYKITAELFGNTHPRYFMCPGEIYVKKDYEGDSLTKKMVIPHCAYVSYKHAITADGKIDDTDDCEGEISDEEFKKNREKIK